MTEREMWYEEYVKKLAAQAATAAYLVELKKHSEAHAKKLAQGIYSEYLKRYTE
ncbi:hypothetical protein [Escherichia phage vB_EcoP_PAS7]|uniref:Uncharacterized protein n=1 Tax=Escherichia phage vB_EcoP_PAS7 TaxID=3053875 RepID=A0AA51VHF8_9CAUD|nr:hypothetical protein [Escherichia phage vB_EcoP_PAS7]